MELIPYDLSFSFSSLWVNRAKQAAKTLGWSVEVTNPKSSPDAVVDAIRGAIARKVDGIGIQVYDCNLIQAALDDAIKAKIPVISDQGFDCTKSKFTHTVGYAPGLYKDNDGSLQGFLTLMGRTAADWLAVKAKGKGKVIVLEAQDVKAARVQSAGFKSELKTVCPNCTIVDSVVLNTTLAGPQIQQKVAASLLKHQDADAVVNTIADYVITSGAGAAIQASPRASKLLLPGVEGAAPNMDLIRNGGPQQTASCQDVGWDAYTMMDDFNHLFNGLKPAESGIGVTMVDKDHNLNPSGACVPQKNGKPLDFSAAYDEAWTNAR